MVFEQYIELCTHKRIYIYIFAMRLFASCTKRPKVNEQAHIWAGPNILSECALSSPPVLSLCCVCVGIDSAHSVCDSTIMVEPFDY